MAQLRIPLILLSLLLVVAVFLVSCSSDDTDQGCEVLGCPDNQACIDGACICTEGYIRCNVNCIPAEDCCTEADCSVGEACIEGNCQDPCLDIACEAPEICIDGTCSCPAGEKLCGDACIPSSGCCEDAECGNGSVCYEHACKGLCEVVTCSHTEYCEAGECLCKEGYHRSVSGVCLPKGLCSADADCSVDEACVTERCLTNCYSYKEPVQISECFLEQAALEKDVTKCELVKEDRREICYYRVAIAAKDRKICAKLQSNPPIDIYQYNQQNCVIEVAKQAEDPTLCENTPTWTSLDPDDLDGYCRQEVKFYIESLKIKDIDECGNDCDCRLRFAKRGKIDDCIDVCPEKQGECTDYHYFWEE